MKFLRTYSLLFFLVSWSFPNQKERNLEEFGFSTKLESYRHQIDRDMQIPEISKTKNFNVPSPVLPKLENNYTDLVPPPTKPRSRKFYQPKFKDYVPDTKKEFKQERSQRIRDYKRPPDLDVFIQDHKKEELKIFGNTTYGLTGLYKTVDAFVLPKGTQVFYSGISHIKYNRSFGEKVKDGGITKFVIPMGIATTIYDQFEIALTGNMVNEKSLGFPLINDFEKTEMEEVQLMAKYQWMHNPVHGLRSAFGFGVANANGKQVTRRGSDGTSYSGFMTVTKNFDKFLATTQIGLTLASGKDYTGNETPNTLFYNIGFEAPIKTNTRLIFELQGYDWNGYGNNVDFCVGARYKVREEFNVELFMPFNVIDSRLPQDYSYYVHGGVSVKI